MYDISELLSKFLHRPGLVKKLSQKRLKEILEAEERMGEMGEQFVLEYEKNRIGLPLSSKIKQVSLIDPLDIFLDYLRMMFHLDLI